MIKNFFKGEAAKLKEMNFTEKRQYLWEYYKLHFGLTLVLLLIVLVFLDAWVFHPAKDEVLHIAWLAGYEDDGKFQAITEKLDTVLVTDPEKETTVVTSFATTDNPEYDMAKTQQFSALLSVGALDVFLAGGWDAVVESLPTSMISPADETMAALKASDTELYDRISPMLKEVEFVSEDGEEMKGVYAIPLNDAAFINNLDFITEDLYFCISVTTDKFPEIVKTLQLFFADA